METKDVKLPPVGKLKDKGIENVEQLDKILTDADRLAGTVAEKDRRILELEAELRGAEDEDGDGIIEEDPGNGGAPASVMHEPSQGWGLGEQNFQNDMASGRGVEAVKAIAFWAAGQKQKGLETRLERAEREIEEFKTVEAWAAAAEDLTSRFDEKWLEDHKSDVMKFIKSKKNAAPSKGELFQHMYDIYKAEEDANITKTVVSAEVEGKKRKGFVEGEGDAAPKTGVDLSSMSVEEMEKVLPVSDPNKPITEGE